MFNNFKKIIDLVKKNSEKIILADQQNIEDSVVIMNLNEYEKLIDEIETMKQVQALTDRNLIDNINKNIAEWREENHEKNDKLFADEFIREENRLNNNEFTDDELDDENLYYYNDNEFFTHFNIENEDDINNVKEKKIWNIPVDIQEGAE